LGARGGGAPRLAAHHPGDAQLPHEPGDPVAAHGDAFAAKLPPDLADPVHLEVVLVHPGDLDLELGIASARADGGRLLAA
jgi:hypothetical protein